ncbi:alpha/beta fold hydrolase [Methyloversatilis discipulorum]|uniref:alpha/beta fold hydrolase n=1 Tax=Methyloversatilis discipulorum TaxID=1119528 RepID=UPI001A4492DD|nr:alpha/beta hydrolase [Methyloversatilis discipulorum]MBL8466270.1 alpha/beta hydrolase [Methyloversatilis discipulorum]
MNIPSSRLLFLHANGYPAGVYRAFLDPLAARCTVDAIDAIGTEARHRPGHGWRRMRVQVMERIEALPDGRLVLVGHSMGGYLAAMAAARLPQRVSQVVLIDSPMVLGWRATLVSAAKATGLTWKLGPAPVAARRRNHWASREEARAHLGGKDFVQRWAPGVLDDFIRAGLHEHPGGGVTLAIPRETERDVYATIAHRDALLAVRRLRARGTPVGFITGSHSEETRLAGREQNRRFWGRDWVELPTGHLVPMEAPEACAGAVLSFLDRINADVTTG